VSPIVPRWEWRAFGDDFGEADARFAATAPERTQDSDETYLLSSRSDASVKVRDGLMDVKRLEAVDEDGLEQWKPVIKADFPLPAAVVQDVLAALGVPAVPLDRPEYTFEELIAEVVGPNPDLRAVEVHKHRDHFTVGGAMAELSTIRADGKDRRTIAVESEDPTLVVGAVRELGLPLEENQCLARGLKAMLAFGG
jgi:exopolyphosphatase / guanosine-5'-triphosphate,3'-diphosphate pyrophosphatase